MKWIYRIVIVLLLGPLISACTQEEKPQAPTKKTMKTVQASSMSLLTEPLPFQRYELTTQVLSAWRNHAESKPTLLLLSNDPLLQPVPEALRVEVTARLKTADPDQLAKFGSQRQADPLLLRDMTLDAALRAGYFARVVWVIPQPEGAVQIAAQALGRQLQEAGFASADEVASLRQVGALVEGRLRDVPITIGPMSALQALNEAAVVHIDPSFYEKLYVNEIKTPLLPLVNNILEQLKTMQISTLGLTCADANLDQRFSLDGRYLGDFLAMMFAEPQKLGKELPEVWKGQAEILYLKNFMQKDMIVQIAKQMVATAPQSAWARFTFYRAAQESNAGEAALQALAEAVQLDPVYALEYEHLAEQAYDRGRPDAALEMLKLAQVNFPDNPHLRLKIAQLANELGEQKTALELARSLQSLDWSEVYHPQMPQFLKGFVKHLEQ